MKILQVMDSYSTEGGMERFVFNFSQNIQSQDIETLLATLKCNGHVNWGTGTIRVVDVSNSNPLDLILDFQPDLIIWHLSYRTATIIEKLASLIPTIVTVHGVMCPSGARLFRDKDRICLKSSGKKCLWNWYVHRCGSSSSPAEAIRALKHHQNVLSALKRCQLIYVVSNAIKDFMCMEGIPEEKIRIFDNTLGKITKFPKLEVVRQSGKINILFIGRLVYSKGVQYLIASISKLKKAGINVRCNIAGDGWYRNKLESLVSSLELGASVRFLGKIPGDQVRKVYERSDVVVVPSIWPDPSPLVVPEARSYGKPVIVFDAGGLPEWTNFMDGVYVAKHANVESLSKILRCFAEGRQEEIPQFYRNCDARVDLLTEIDSYINKIENNEALEL